MIRMMMIAVAGLALAACQQPAAPKAEDAAKTQAATTDGAKTDPATVAYAPDPSDAEGDAFFRGPMTLQESAGEGGAPKRYRFAWMGGKHTVIAVEAGAADGKAVIDTDEKGKPITLAGALRASPGDTIALLQVEAEDGPGPGNPDYTPLCGIRPVDYIAMVKSADTVALATSNGNFGGEGARGCSNLILYKKAP